MESFPWAISSNPGLNVSARSRRLKVVEVDPQRPRRALPSGSYASREPHLEGSSHFLDPTSEETKH
jgi:hypothetical protein